MLDVWLGETFPFAKMKVKVVDRDSKGFIAISNLRFRDPVSGIADGEAGLGQNPDEAVNDLINRFVANAMEKRPINGFTGVDFEWAAHEDF